MLVPRIRFRGFMRSEKPEVNLPAEKSWTVSWFTDASGRIADISRHAL